jgi:RNA polymerase sigma-70 factor (ECF subfamily)
VVGDGADRGSTVERLEGIAVARAGRAQRRRGGADASATSGSRNPNAPVDRRTDVGTLGAASDEALLAGMAGGDGHAAQVFVRRFQQRVFGLAVTILADRHAAEDVAQEAFLRAYRHAGSFDARRASVATWLLTITRNAAVDAVRLRRASPADPEAILALALPAPTHPEGDAVLRTEVDRVRSALATLPAEQGRAVVLAAFHGLTGAEVAALEDIPLGTAKTRIRAGLSKLRDGLAIEEVEP